MPRIPDLLHSFTEPYAVEREVEDLVALVNSIGGPVFLFGSSSGAVLALDAATRLGSKVTKLFLYEPFIVDSSRPPISLSRPNGQVMV